jgi:uncharacterized DUF497 family protein
LPAKIDLKWDQQELDAFLKKKTKHGFLEYASILAHVLMEMPLGEPIFGSEYAISTDKMERIRETFRKAREAGIHIDQNLWRQIMKGRPRGRPVDKKSAIICLWVLMVKRDDKVPWAMLIRLLKWFDERFGIMEYEYRSEINLEKHNLRYDDAEYLAKKFKKQCMIKNETIKEYLDGGRKPDWKDKNIETIVVYLRTFVFRATRIFSARSVNFAGDSIEVEVDYQNGGELRTLGMKRDFKTQEYTKLLLDPSDARVFGTVTFL